MFTLKLIQRLTSVCKFYSYDLSSFFGFMPAYLNISDMSVFLKLICSDLRFWHFVGLKPPSNFYCWPSQSGSSVLVLCDVRCGALLFMVIHVIYKYKIGEK